MDTNQKKINKFSEGVGPISDVKGMYAYISKNFNNILEDKPCYNALGVISGITTAYDMKRNKVVYTVHNGSSPAFTLAYNEMLDNFTSFYSFKPKMYISDGKNIFTNSGNSLYVQSEGEYGNYYGTIYKSSIKYIVNKDSLITKTYDNIIFNTSSIATGRVNQNQDMWNSIRITNDYQNTDWQALISNSNLKRVERTWKLDVPRNRVLYTNSDSPDVYTDLSPSEKLFGERIRDKYIQVELEYNNTNNNLLKTNAITILCRESAR
jgi:hypothetical protein